MNEIMSLMNRNISGWMCSGDDEVVMAIVFKNLLHKAAEKRFVQVIIASEDMLPAVSQIVEFDSRNKGYLPSYAHRYFPAFTGSEVDMKERMGEILKRCCVDQDKADDVMAYIDFLTELEREFGEDNHTRNEELLQKYLRASAVERTLNTAVTNGEMTQDECRDWFEDYSDCSSGRIHLKRIMNRLDRNFSLNKDRSKSISNYFSKEEEPDITLRKEGTLLIVAGFGFQDKHIQNVIKEAVLQNPNFHLLVVCYGKKNFSENGEAAKWDDSGITHELVPDFISEDGNVAQNVTVLFSKFKTFVENYPYNSSYEIDNQNNNEAI